MSGIIGVLNDLYVRFMVWLGAEPPPGHEHLIGAEAGPREYIIKAGDTLFSVARKFNVHYERIAQANGIEPSATLQPGQKLLIPPAKWDPSSGPLAQPVPALVTAVETDEQLEEVETMPEVTAPPEQAEPLVEAEPEGTAADEAAPVLAEEPVSPDQELPPEIAVESDTHEEAEAVAFPAEQNVPVEAALSQPVTPPGEVEPAVLSPEQSVTAPERQELFRYEVQRGDTLNGIANRYGISVAQVLAANDITDSDRIFPGQKLIIPGYTPQPEPPQASEAPPAPPPPPAPTDQFFIYTITRGDTLNGIANRYGVDVRDLIDINQIDNPDHIRVGQQLRIPTSPTSTVTRPEPIAEVKPGALPAIVGVDPNFPPQGPAQAVRALFVSYFAIGHPDTRQRIFDLLDTTELNTVVLDVKGEDSWITYPTQVPLAHEIGADRPMIKDFQAVMEQFKARRVYTIARIVTFKDSLLTKTFPEYAVNMSGSAETSSDREYLNWVDPFLKPVWDYNHQLAVEAAQMGFDEIQFSHVRFPFPSRSGALQFSQEATKETRVAAITGFLSIARGQLRPYGVRVSADVLGYTCWRKDDTLIGQDIERMGQYLDVLCPMLYPSTFTGGIAGYKVPVAHPYEVVFESARRAVSRLRPLDCAVRPWIQDFPDYRFDKRVFGKEEVQAQIKGCFDARCDGFMVWDHRVKYTDGAYAPASVQV